MKIKAFRDPVGEDNFDRMVVNRLYRMLRNEGHSRGGSRAYIIAIVDMGRRMEREYK